MIVLTKVVQTCWACPSQWDAWDADSRYYYLRYRWGVGTVDSPHGTQIASFRHGDDLDGSIGLEGFMALAGLALAPRAEGS